MKSISYSKIILLFIFTLAVWNNKLYPQSDLSIKLSEENLTNALAAIVEARGINKGDLGHILTSNWFVNVDNLTADIKPNNQVTLNASVSVYYGLNLEFNNVPIVEHIRGPINGYVSLDGDNVNGRKLIFHPVSTNFSFNGDIPDWLVLIINLFIDPIDLIPPIEINLSTALMPQIVSEIFTPDSPELTSNENEIIIGYSFSGPRKIRVQNDLAGYHAAGNIQLLEGSTWNSYTSPITTWWSPNSVHSFRTASNVISYSDQWWRFNSWDITDPLVQKNVQQNITVGGDHTYSAQFLQAQPITLQTSMEGVITNNVNITFQNQTALSPYSDYAFMPPNNTSVGAINPVTIGSSTYYFQNWDDGLTSQARDVAILQTTMLTANYKGTHLSNNSNAFSNSSQRKFVKTPDGVMHMVYESMGHVWYETS